MPEGSDPEDVQSGIVASNTFDTEAITAQSGDSSSVTSSSNSAILEYEEDEGPNYILPPRKPKNIQNVEDEREKSKKGSHYNPRPANGEAALDSDQHQPKNSNKMSPKPSRSSFQPSNFRSPTSKPSRRTDTADSYSGPSDSTSSGSKHSRRSDATNSSTKGLGTATSSSKQSGCIKSTSGAKRGALDSELQKPTRLPLMPEHDDNERGPSQPSRSASASSQKGIRLSSYTPKNGTRLETDNRGMKRMTVRKSDRKVEKKSSDIRHHVFDKDKHGEFRTIRHRSDHEKEKELKRQNKPKSPGLLANFLSDKLHVNEQVRKDDRIVRHLERASES